MPFAMTPAHRQACIEFLLERKGLNGNGRMSNQCYARIRPAGEQDGGGVLEIPDLYRVLALFAAHAVARNSAKVTETHVRVLSVEVCPALLH